MGEKLERLYNRIEQRFDGVERKMTGMSTAISNLSARFADIENRLGVLERDSATASTERETMEEKLEKRLDHADGETVGASRNLLKAREYAVFRHSRETSGGHSDSPYEKHLNVDSGYTFESMQNALADVVATVDIYRPTLAVSSVEVSENMTVTFTCRADDGRPTPYVILAKRDNRTELTNQSSPLSHSVSRVRCQDAGVYTCTASNGMGPDTMDDVTLRVECSPRSLLGQSEEHPSANFKGEPVFLKFNITAYPTPESFNFTFLGSNLTTVTTSPAGIALNASCQHQTGSLYLVTCVVFVDYVTSTAAGFYRVTLTNDQGHGDVIFQIKFYSDTSDEGGRNDQHFAGDGGLSTGVTAAVSVVVTIVVVVVVFTALVVWAWRRHWILPCADRDAAGGKSRDEGKLQSIELSAITDSQTIASSDYEGLRTGEVGLTSFYSTLTSNDDIRTERGE
ncbi:hypothetical protein BaRGS_00023192, partial [Batillaria attramentaria]